jgi:hypothetical protein
LPQQHKQLPIADALALIRQIAPPFRTHPSRPSDARRCRAWRPALPFFY